MDDVASRCPRWWCGEKMLVGTLCATLFAAAVSTFTYNTGGLAFLYAPPAQTAAAKEALLASIPPKANAYAEDWLIFTTVNVPSIQAKTLCAMEGWQGLVIGDKKTPDDWNAPGCIYLSIAQQEVLGYEIVKPGVLPYGRYERKNVGYLFAIERGAKRIFETDDDNIQRAAVPDVRTEHECTRRPSPSALTWNALEHFGAPQLWRRGFPLDYVKIKGVADQPLTYTESCVAFTPVHNGLADVDPDLDSVQRLTKDQTLIRNVQFDDVAPVLSFPRGTFSAWNSQNTVWHRSAFAFMVLPITTGWRVDDIWRGYWGAYVHALIPYSCGPRGDVVSLSLSLSLSLFLSLPLSLSSFLSSLSSPCLTLSPFPPVVTLRLVSLIVWQHYPHIFSRSLSCTTHSPTNALGHRGGDQDHRRHSGLDS